MKALILVDIQNDFMPGGALPVPEGDAVVPVANALMDHVDVIVATRDHHPASHKSFAVHHEGREPGEVVDLNGLDQVLWPVHCVQGTPGNDFVDALEIGRADAIFPKGTDPEIDSYSGFYDNGHRKDTGMGEWLRAKGVDTVYVLGVATDYCVKFTALDAIADGFTTYLVEDGVRGVNLQPGDSEAAIEEMRAAGAHIVSSRDV